MNRTYRFGDLEIDVQNLRVTVGGSTRTLEPKSFRLLLFLVENPQRVLTKEEILGAVWADTTVSDNSLARAVAQIRKALDDDSKMPKYIETVPSIGYRFIGKIHEEPPPPVSGGIVQAPLGFEGNSSSAPRKSATLAYIIGAGLFLVLVGAAWIAAARSSSVPYPLRVTKVSKLTSYSGDEREPAISPDGSYVAFSWSGPADDNYDIYVVQAGGQEPLRLTRDPAPDSYPAWSPDGRQIAFIRQVGQSAEIIVVPPLGGPERSLHRFSRIGADLDFTQHPLLTWSADGKWIVYSGQSDSGKKYQLFSLSAENGTVRAISSPEMELNGDSSPALSADASALAFVRYLAPRNGRVMIQPMENGIAPHGEPSEVPNSGLGMHSPAWLDGGRQLLFADEKHIYQWERKKGTTPVYAAEVVIGGMSIGPKRGDTREVVIAGFRADTDIWSIPLDTAGTRATGPPAVFLRSTESDAHPDFSPDGRHIAFTSARSGAGELWVCDADGSNLRQLTHLGAHVLSYPKWSPDGKSIVFHARVPDVAEVYVVDLNEGAPRQITHEDPGLALATWSNDGRYLYASTLVGGTATTYRFPATGGSMERLWQGGLVRETPDGKYVLYWKPNAPGIFRRSLAGNLGTNPEELLIPDFWPNNQLGGFDPVANGVYYVSGDAKGKPGPVRFFSYASRKSIDVAPPVPGLGRGFTISPDRRRVLTSANAGIGGDLLSLELR